jgi:D-xylose 1-dehydrogenase (NADP+, D-xylono-1,5-lactone-forming)
MVLRRLRWGLMGTARINHALIPAIRAGARSALTAVASREPGRAEAYARDWDIPRAIAGYDLLVSDPDIDVIYVPLPNHLHADWTVAAARAGKHVLCEKPLALTPADVDRVADAARTSGVVVAEAFMYRHHGQTRRILELVAEGAVGELRFIRGSFTFPLAREGDVRLRPDWGGGSLWDVGCYPVGYARLLAGAEPETVSGLADMGSTGVDLAFTGTLRFPGGVLAAFDCGFRAAFRTSIEIVGTEASIDVAAPFKPTPREQVRLTRAGAVSLIDIEGEALYSGEVEDIERAALDRAPQAVSLADSRGNVATLAALLASASTGRRIHVGTPTA